MDWPFFFHLQPHFLGQNFFRQSIKSLTENYFNKINWGFFQKSEAFPKPHNLSWTSWDFRCGVLFYFCVIHTWVIFFFTVNLIYDFVLLESAVLINLSAQKAAGLPFCKLLSCTWWHILGGHFHLLMKCKGRGALLFRGLYLNDRIS